MPDCPSTYAGSTVTNTSATIVSGDLGLSPGSSVTGFPPGTVVDVIDRDGHWSGRGFYNGHSRIALRVLTIDPAEAVDEAFFARKLGQAINLRRAIHQVRRGQDVGRAVIGRAV